MKAIFFFLIFSFSVCTAQQVSFERDSLLTTKDTIHFSIKNNMLSPMFFIMDPKDNIPKAVVYQKELLFKPSQKITSAIKVPRNILAHDSALVNFNSYFTFKVGYGNPSTVKPDYDYVYLLPYKRYKKLIQGNFGNFSHDHISSYYAFDFGTKIGDTIYAAREGKVVMLREDSKKYGRSRKFAKYANYITIQHSDGTTASYYHLRYNGVLVEKGDIVKRGEKIGISGMTGFTTIPHLHFVVHISTTKDGNVSIPIEFEGYVGRKFKKGKRYSRKK